MKNKNVKKIIIIVVILLVVIGIILAILNKNTILLNKLEYDIVVASNLREYEGMDPENIPASENEDMNSTNVQNNEYEGMDTIQVPAGGYSTKYYYTLINSIKKEKYTIVYENVWDVHNERGDKDKVTITINKIDDNEIQENTNKYGKTSKLLSVKELLDKDINEKYNIFFNN